MRTVDCFDKDSGVVVVKGVLGSRFRLEMIKASMFIMSFEEFFNMLKKSYGLTYMKTVFVWGGLIRCVWRNDFWRIDYCFDKDRRLVMVKGVFFVGFVFGGMAYEHFHEFRKYF